MPSEQLGAVLPFVLIALAFWLLVIRPTRRRQQDLKRTQSSVTVGSEVMLSSGIFGTVTSVADDTMQLQVDAGTSIKVARQAVARVVVPTSADVAAVPPTSDDH